MTVAAVVKRNGSGRLVVTLWCRVCQGQMTVTAYSKDGPGRLSVYCKCGWSS